MYLYALVLQFGILTEPIINTFALWCHSSLTSPTNCDLCTPVKGDDLSHCEQNSTQHWLWYIFSCGLMAVKLNSMTMGVWVVYGTPFPAPWHTATSAWPGPVSQWAWYSLTVIIITYSEEIIFIPSFSFKPNNVFNLPCICAISTDFHPSSQ